MTRLTAPHGAHRGSEPGFVLVVTIWLAALVALAAVVVTGWAGRGVDDVLALDRAAWAEVTAFSAGQRVLYAFAVQPLSVRGLEMVAGRRRDAGQLAPDPAAGPQDPFAAPPQDQAFIALDGRPYALDGAIVRIQDGVGLQALATLDEAALGRLLVARRVPEAERARLIDALGDYVDGDRQARLNGAEAPDYGGWGLPGPRDAPLVTSWELRSVLGWDRWPDLWGPGNSVARLFNADGTGLLNPNTAPVELLATIPGLDGAAARRLARQRGTTPLRGPDELARLAGNAQELEPSRYTFLPDGSFRIEILVPGRPLVREIAGRIAPQDERSPWRFDHVLDLPGTIAPPAAPAAGDAVPLFPGTPA